MISQTLDVVLYFLCYIVKIILISREHAAGKHHVLPNQDTIFIAKIIEYILLINTPTPDTKHVHIGICSRLNDMFVGFVCYTSREVVKRDVIGTFHKHILAIEFHVH